MSVDVSRIIGCWALADKRAKHLCAFETLGLNARCRKPSQEEVKKAWHRLSVRLHPDRNGGDELATEAMRCINLAKQHLFEVHFGGAAARVAYKHEADRAEATARAAEEAKIKAAAAEAVEAAAAAAQEARLAAAGPGPQPQPERQPDLESEATKRPAPESSSENTCSSAKRHHTTPSGQADEHAEHAGSAATS